jgi:hypothetical protein
MWWVLLNVWAIVANLLLVIVTLTIFSGLETRFEILVIAILGLIYTALRGAGLTAGKTNAGFFILLNKDLNYIRQRLRDDVSEREQEVRKAEADLTRFMVAYGIEGFGLLIVSLICAYHLLTALWQSSP